MAFAQSAAQQPIIQIPDDLVALFSRNLTFNAEQQATLAAREKAEQIEQENKVAPVVIEEIKYSISQHYNHSAYLAKKQAQQALLEQEHERDAQRRSSLPPETDMMSPEVVLRNHGVDTSTLTPSQLQLFRIASIEQQRRLVELWSICPPSGAQNIPALAWSSTTVEQEEHLARARYERSQEAAQGMDMAGPSFQNNDGRWTQQPVPEGEPYMVSGYEELMFDNNQHTMTEGSTNQYTHVAPVVSSRAMDPVYLGADYARQQQQMAMATQYGAFEQFRGNTPMDVMDVM